MSGADGRADGPAGSLSLANRVFPVEVAQGFAGKDQYERDALQHQHRGIGKPQPALQQAAGRAEAAEQDGDRDDRDRVLPAR